MTEQIPTGKGRPTPKRKDAEARRGGPVAPPPSNRREAAKQLRAKQAEARKSVRQGNLTGDDRSLLARDRGPIRRLVRDLIDGRRNLGFLLLPVALATFASNIAGNARFEAAMLGVWAATLLGVLLDMVSAAFLIRKSLREQFPQEQKVRGHIAYGLLRTTVMRRFRMPRPAVARHGRR